LLDLWGYATPAGNVAGSTPAVEREILFARDRHVCAYCGQKFRESDLTADHVIPESRGGRWSWTNL